MESPTTKLAFHAAVRSDVGLVRENNEDSAYARHDFLILADGMGGHSSGEVASAVAVHTFAAQDGERPESLFEAADHTRQILRAMSTADETLQTMGTTIVALWQHGDAFYTCHIGDSRFYRLSGDGLTQLTTDHTHVQHLLETGRITPEQVHSHPYRAMLLKSIDDQPGGAPPDLAPVELTAGERVLLCSDGLSDYVPEHVIADILRLEDREEAADALIATALQAGTRDNITVIVADLVAEDGTDQGSGPTFAGAAEDSLHLSEAAAEALSDTAPQYTGVVRTGPETADDPLTRTRVIDPVGHTSGGDEAPIHGSGARTSPVILGLAALAVLAVAAGVSFFL